MSKAFDIRARNSAVDVLGRRSTARPFGSSRQPSTSTRHQFRNTRNRHRPRAEQWEEATSSNTDADDYQRQPFEGVGEIEREAARLREEAYAEQQAGGPQSDSCGAPPVPGGNGLPQQDEAALAVTAEDEQDEARKPYHQRLAMAARQGDTAAAEEVLSELRQAGMPPGPRAFHGLVFAYTKAADSEGAWQAARQGHMAGVLLMADTFILLIHGHMQEGKVEAAQGLLTMMVSADHVDARLGWLVLVQGLLAGGYLAKAAEELARGQQMNWTANAAIYEGMVKATVEAGYIDEAVDMINSMRVEGVAPTARHVYPILRAYAAGGALEFLQEKVLRDVATSEIPIDAECFSCFLRGVIDNRDRGLGYEPMDKLKYETEALMARFQVKPDSRFRAHQCEGYFSFEDDLNCQQEAPNAFESMAKLFEREKEVARKLKKRVPRACPMPPPVLDKYLQRMANTAPFDLSRSLAVMRKQRWAIPEGTLAQDESGRTIATRWLAERCARLASSAYKPASQIANLVNEMYEAGPQSIIGGDDDGPAFNYVDDIRVDAEGTVVDENGKPVAASKLTIPELRAELEAKNLMTAGSRREMYKRVQAARRNLAAGTSLERQRAKEAKARAKFLAARPEKEIEREALRSEREEAEEEVMTENFDTGTIMEVATKEVEVAADELALEDLTVDDLLDDVDDDVEDDAIITRRASAADDDDESDDEDGLLHLRAVADVDADEDSSAATPGIVSMGDEGVTSYVDDVTGIVIYWGPTPMLDATLKWQGDNYTAGAAVAVRIINDIDALGGRPSPTDIATLVRGVLAERDTRLVWQALRILSRYWEDLDEDAMRALVYQLFGMLLDGGELEEAGDFVAEMIAAGIEPEADDIPYRRFNFLLMMRDARTSSKGDQDGRGDAESDSKGDAVAAAGDASTEDVDDALAMADQQLAELQRLR